jgi:hypothetical protein
MLVVDNEVVVVAEAVGAVLVDLVVVLLHKALRNQVFGLMVRVGGYLLTVSEAVQAVEVELMDEEQPV